MAKRMLYRLGVLMVRLRWVVVAIWAVVFALGGLMAPRALPALSAAFGDASTESRRAQDLLQQRLDISESSVVVVFQSDALAVDDPRYERRVREAVDAIGPGELPRATGVLTYFDTGRPSMVSRDGHTTYAFVTLDASVDEALDLVPTIRKRLNVPGMETYVTGGVPIFYDVDHLSERDLQRAEVIAFPVVLVALLLVFGSVVAAGLPVAIGGLSVVIGLGLIYLLTFVTPMSIFVLNIATFLGLGIAIDYSLLVVTRFREELAARPVTEAVGITIATAGRAILFSALTSIIGLSGLLFFDFMMLRSLGIGGILVISLSLLSALTLLPAVLGMLGHRVNLLSIRRPRPARHSLWHWIATTVMRRPAPFILVLAPALLLLGAPFLRVNLSAPWADILPDHVDSRQGWDLAAREFGPGQLSPVTLAVRSDGPILAPEHVGELYDLIQPLAQDPRVERVESLVTVDPRLGREDYQRLYRDPERVPSAELRAAIERLARNDVTMVQITSRHAPMAPETQQLVKDIRRIEDTPLTVLVTGATAELIDSVELMYEDFPWVIAYIVGTTYLVLLVLFRSVVLPLKAVLMNVMSIFASYGALVVIFQDGFLSGPLGFTARGSVEATVPIILFTILFGLSMDYEVFLLTRVKEEYEGSADNTGSVALGMERTGRVITSAAMILVLVSGAFASAEILVVKSLGLGTAIAIFLDATVVRALLVPALMRVLGHWNWWAPGFIKGLPAPRPEEPG